ncbi:MAG: hypothetical protein ACK4SY_06320 [Pyrobaculum sp.]
MQTAVGHYAVLPTPEQYVLYEGGAIGASSLGFLEVDREGNVTPAPRGADGPRGLPHNCHRVARAGRWKIEVGDCRLYIREDGPAVSS